MYDATMTLPMEMTSCPKRGVPLPPPPIYESSTGPNDGDYLKPDDHCYTIMTKESAENLDSDSDQAV